jgi:hypothetical protein
MEAPNGKYKPDGKVDYYGEYWEQRRATAKAALDDAHIDPALLAWMHEHVKIVRPPRPESDKQPSTNEAPSK